MVREGSEVDVDEVLRLLAEGTSIWRSSVLAELAAAPSRLVDWRSRIATLYAGAPRRAYVSASGRCGSGCLAVERLHVGSVFYDVYSTADLAEIGTQVEAQNTSGSRMSPPNVMIRTPEAVCYCSGGPGTQAYYDPTDPCRCRGADHVGWFSPGEGGSVLVWLFLPVVAGGIVSMRTS